MHDKAVTSKTLAKAAAITTKTVTRARKGDNIELVTVNTFAEVLEVDVDVLIDTAPTPPASLPTRSLARRVFVIGGTTRATDFPAFELDVVRSAGKEIGERLAEADAQLLACSLFEDSIDRAAVYGYLDTNSGVAIQIFCPQHPSIKTLLTQLNARFVHGSRLIRPWWCPGPDPLPGVDNDGKPKVAWGPAWTYCQLTALEEADVVVVLGGRVSESANILLRVAEARRKPIVAYTELGGVAKLVHERLNWPVRHPGLDPGHLTAPGAYRDVVSHINAVVSSEPRKDKTKPIEKVFISRASVDASFDNPVMEGLARWRIKSILGDDQRSPTADTLPAIEIAMSSCDTVLVLWSRYYALSPWCHDELQLALRHEQVAGQRLWVYNIDGCELVPNELRRRIVPVTRTPALLVGVLSQRLSGERALDL